MDEKNLIERLNKILHEQKRTEEDIKEINGAYEYAAKLHSKQKVNLCAFHFVITAVIPA